MTQPAPPAKTGVVNILTRRIGPAPVWLYFVVLVVGLAIFLRWRAGKTASKQAANTDNSSLANQSPNLTTQSTLGTPWYSDVFVNVQQPGEPGAPGPAGPAGPPGPGGDTTPPVPVPAPVTAPPRVTSITYTVVSGDTLERIAAKLGKTWGDIYYPNQATLEAVAKQHGFSSNPNGHWIFPGEQLVIPQ